MCIRYKLKDLKPIDDFEARLMSELWDDFRHHGFEGNHFAQETMALWMDWVSERWDEHKAKAMKQMVGTGYDESSNRGGGL